MGIYTVGNEQDYDAALAASVVDGHATPITKRGPWLQPDGSQYLGGCVFESVHAAQAFIDRIGKTGEWAVYELDAAWPDDVWHGHLSENFMRLKRDAVLVGKAAPARPLDSTPRSVAAADL